MPQLPLTGGCLCGAVRYEVTEPLVSASYCHCTRCQRRTGTAASAQARVAPGALRITQGEELVREFVPEDGWPKCFCSACGGALWSRHPTEELRSVRLGTFDTIRASAHSGVSSSPTPHRGRRYRTTACRATRKGRRTDGQVPAQGHAGPKTTAVLRERVAELERERELLNAIANYAPSLICLVDDDGRVRPFASNRAFEQMLGYEPHETGGDLFWDKYVADGERSRARDCIVAAIRSRASSEREGRWLQRDGSEIDVVWTCTPLPQISSGPVYLISGTDVTERKRHEAEVRQSRARIVAAADDARRRLERNLHDGAQQRLLALLMQLRGAQRGLVDATETIEHGRRGARPGREGAPRARPGDPSVRAQRPWPRGRAPDRRRPRARPGRARRHRHAARHDVAVAAYYIVSEALTNVAKYAEATRAAVRVRESDGRIVVVVEDDGKGGADPFAGSGLPGLGDRVAALDGSLVVESPPGGGTRIRAELPLQ